MWVGSLNSRFIDGLRKSQSISRTCAPVCANTIARFAEMVDLPSSGMGLDTTNALLFLVASAKSRLVRTVLKDSLM